METFENYISAAFQQYSNYVDDLTSNLWKMSLLELRLSLIPSWTSLLVTREIETRI